MKQFKTYVFGLVITLSFLTPKAHAANVAGAEILYKSLGGDSFLITLNEYIDCNGLRPGKSVDLKLSAGTTFLSTITVNITDSLDVTFDACYKNINNCTKCKDTSCRYPSGYELRVYKAIIRLKSYAYCGFKISFSDTARSNFLTNTDPKQGFYIEAQFDKCHPSSAPVFDTLPCFFKCLLTCATISFSAKDPDGDFLIYHLIPPMKDSINPVTWLIPYAYNKPLKFDSFPRYNANWDPRNGSCAGFHLDSLYGKLHFKPTKYAVTAFAVKIEKWRDSSGKNIKIGEVTRDIEISLDACTKPYPPILSGWNGTNHDSIHVLVGTKLHASINSGDPNTMDTVDVTYYTDMSYDTIVVEKNKQHPRTYVDWIPIKKDIRSKPYELVLIANDRECWSPGTTFRTYYIFVDSVVTGMDEDFVIENSLRIYPNPATNQFNIFYELPINALVQLEVYDLTGRRLTVLSNSTQSSGEHTINYSPDLLPSGIYILRGQFGNKIVQRQMILMR